KFLRPIFASAAVGDFTHDIEIPDNEDEFTELYMGIQIMLYVIRDKVNSLEALNASLEEKVKEKTNKLTQAQRELEDKVLLRTQELSIKAAELEKEKILDYVIFENVGEGLVVLDSKGIVGLINQSALQILK